MKKYIVLAAIAITAVGFQNCSGQKTGSDTLGSNLNRPLGIAVGDPTPSCELGLSSNRVDKHGSFSYYITVEEAPTFDHVIFSGSKDGVTDETDVYYGPFNASYGYFLDLTGDTDRDIVGDYYRSFKAVDASGNVLCSSNVVNIRIVDFSALGGG